MQITRQPKIKSRLPHRKSKKKKHNRRNCMLECSRSLLKKMPRYVRVFIEWYDFEKRIVDESPLDSVLAWHLNTLRPRRQNGWQFPDNIFKYIFLNENICILNTIGPKFVPKGPIDNNTALVQIMAWRQTGAKSLSEATMAKVCNAYMRHLASVS